MQQLADQDFVLPDRLIGVNRNAYDIEALPAWIRDRLHVSNGCWLWTGGTNKGYGQVWTQREGFPGWGQGSPVRYVHRLVFELLVRSPDEGETLDHLCLRKRCCNPSDLDPVTHNENGRRASRLIENGGMRVRQPTCKRGHPVDPTRRGGCRTCTRIIAYCRYHSLPHPDETGIFALEEYIVEPRGSMHDWSSSVMPGNTLKGQGSG